MQLRPDFVAGGSVAAWGYRMSAFEIAAVIAVVWILLSLLTAAFWHLIMSPLPHPDDLVGAEPPQRGDAAIRKAANRRRDAA